MLELKNISKTYHVGDIETRALDGVSVSFRAKEFVAILGTSGSGKTTCLNIVGGLDRYDSGEMTIKGKKTSDFTDREWDAYRNNSIGFVFQSYNLISHLSIVENVELGMTLSGVSASEKHARALEMLDRVGLHDHLHKRPNQLSGGQMQRVAIARALANDPEILLCDEPTGALDTTTSRQIMDIISEVAKDRLVIMVTHNPELAEQYADRTIRFQDGKITDDSHPHVERDKPDEFHLKRTSMGFLTALRLSFNNIRTKKGRTFLTAFASSIGIIGIAVILSLSDGFKMQVDSFQSDTMSEFPIIVMQNAAEVDMESFRQMHEEATKKEEELPENELRLYDPAENSVMHTNVLTEDYIEYIEKADPAACSGIGYTRIVSMNLLHKTDGAYTTASLAAASSGGSASMANGISSMQISSYPTMLSEGETSYLEKNYDLLSGAYPTEPTDLVLVVGSRDRVDVNLLKSLGISFDKDAESISYESLVGETWKLVSNDDYYVKTEMDSFMPGTDFDAMAEAEDTLTLRLSGIVQMKPEVEMGVLSAGIAYSDALSTLVIDRAADSEIVKAQQDSDMNVMTMEPLDEAGKKQVLSYLGGDGVPYMVMLYPTDFEGKQAVLEYLDAYNEGLPREDQIIYTDLASTMSDLTGGIMDGITIVLIAFAAISLVVSMIMICIITYTSVLERTKEIGILRALGARKKDITRVFDAETMLLGVFSGVLGVVLAWALTFPINAVIFSITELSGVAVLRLEYAALLVFISTVLTVIGGHVPAKMASKKDAVEALRSE